MNPKKLILVGFLLVLFGVLAPFLMVLGFLESTFTLNFLSFAASLAGLFIGLIGATFYTLSKRRQDG